MPCKKKYLEPSMTTRGYYKAHLEGLARGILIIPIKGVPILLFASTMPDEEDNQFICWLYCRRHISGIPTIRVSADVADARLERKLRYENANLKARSRLRNRTRYASSTPVAAGSDPAVRINPLPPTAIGETRPRTQGDPGHNVQNHSRKMVNPAEGVSHTPMNSPTLRIRATSSDTGIGPDDDVVSGVSPHGIGGYLAHRAASVVVGVPKEEHEKVLLELSGLCEK